MLIIDDVFHIHTHSNMPSSRSLYHMVLVQYFLFLFKTPPSVVKIARVKSKLKTEAGVVTRCHHCWESCRCNCTSQLQLNHSTPAVPNCCCSQGSALYWSNPAFLISDIWTLWRSVLSARVSECQKLKLVG